MRRSLFAALAVLALSAPMVAFAAPPATTPSRAPQKNPFSQTVTGVSTITGETFTGVVNVVGFQSNSPTSTDAIVHVIGMLGSTPVDMVTTVPVLGGMGDPASGSCPILSLTLGPLHLDLLGLVIDLNQINLNITAQSGPGNLLGNLLCAVANLLNNNTLGTTLTTLLNNLLSILGGLGL